MSTAPRTAPSDQAAPPAPGSWQERAVGWLGRRKRLSVVVPVVVLVLGTPHSCPLC